jgi:hypothetical protein
VGVTRRIVFAVLVGSLAALVLFLGERGRLPPLSFKAFYCAGVTVDRGQDPYLVEPLRSCEHVVAPGELPAYAVEPAPLPAYALAPFALLAHLSYPRAHALYLLLSVTALAGIALGIAALAGLDPALAGLAFLSLWFLNISYGELPPFATAGIVLCGLAIRRSHWWFAATCAAVAALQPTLAVPLWVALFLFLPRMRLPLASAGAALLALDAAIGGPGRVIEYFTQVLPLQALAEVHANDQFSLTHLLATFGVADSLALRLGSLSYLVMLVAGIAIARRLVRATGEIDYLALAPPAFILLGGTFVHDLQFMAALPLAIVVMARSRNAVATVATLVLCIPWTPESSKLTFSFMLVSVMAVALISSRGRSGPARAGWIAAGVAAAAAAILLRPSHQTIAMLPPSSVVSPVTSASVDWRIYLEATPARTTAVLADLIRKVPTWSALLALLAAVARAPAVRESPLNNLVIPLTSEELNV